VFRLEKFDFGFVIVLEMMKGEDVEEGCFCVVNGVVSCVVISVDAGPNFCLLDIDIFGSAVETSTNGLRV